MKQLYSSAWFLSILVVLVTGCVNTTEKGTEIAASNTSNTFVSTQQSGVLPLCTIEQGSPTTDTTLTLHVRCKKGSVSIDEATITLDGTAKPVEIQGDTINDYIGFRDLQPNSTYTASLEVIAGGEKITKQISATTQKQTDTPPKWTKSFYDMGLIYKDKDVGSGKTILDLKKVCTSSDGTKIAFAIGDIRLDTSEKPYDDIVKLENGVLKVGTLDSYLYGTKGSVTVTIRATTKSGSSTAKVKFAYELTFFEG